MLLGFRGCDWRLLHRAGVDQALQHLLHQLDAVGERLDRHDDALAEHRLWRIGMITFARRQADKVDAHDGAADSDLADTVGVQFLVHCVSFLWAGCPTVLVA